MADQASMIFNGPGAASGRMGASQTTAGPNGSGSGPADVVGGIAGLGEDLLSLTELQARLAAIELRQNIAAAKVGGTVIMTGAVLALAALPIALAGIAELLVIYGGVNRGFALIAVAGMAFVIAGICIAVALGRLRASDLGFPLSREEFARNLNWLRTVVLYSGRAGRR